MQSDTIELKTVEVQHSNSPQEASRRFLDRLGDWVQDCIEEYADEPPIADGGGHDQGTFTTAWSPWIRLRDDGRALQFMKNLRDKVKQGYEEIDWWYHGYWRMQEAHHGTEHFELFLGDIWRLAPDDAETVEQFVDAAEHFGNWSPDVPDWFDRDAGLYKAFHFGTDGVMDEPGEEFNRPDHFRCANICMLAWWMTQEQRYLDLADAYAGRWAEGIVQGPELPMGLLPDGPVYELTGQAGELYAAHCGQASHGGSPVDRAENLLASGAVGTLVRLAKATGRSVHRQAAARILDVLVTQVTDPDAGPAADVLRDWHRQTGDTRYNHAVRDAVATAGLPRVDTLAIDAFPTNPPTGPGGGREPGIGKRADKPLWYEDGRPRRVNPITLAAAAELERDENMATRAVDLACAHFRLARMVYPDGRHHGCSARTVSAIARGHGRCNNAGMVTAVLVPLMEAFRVQL